MDKASLLENYKKAPRRSSLELLRIICMLFIVAHHFGIHGQYGDMQMSQFNSFIIMLLSAGGKLGVNIYVLISGYFLVGSSFKLRRLINTIALTIFYSVSIYLVMLFALPEYSFSFGELFSRIFVIYKSNYWFVTCYVAMVLLSPFINKLINALSKREHLALVLLLVLMSSHLPRLDSYFDFSQIGWFITVYIIAAYLRLYPEKIFSSKLITGVASLVLCITIGLLSASTDLTNILCLATSVALFTFFNNLEIKSRAINLISKTTFGIYLIHDNKLVRQVLWSNLLKCPYHAQFDSFWLFSACAVLLVFIVCSLIELGRMGLTILISKIIKKGFEKKDME